ncbi:radiation-inducible immediate-early gene IEX-1 [Entelurus aequoreus]|uniref:radiation-inducible immediate-early gene IEX-1 n=1 Tax=Entelurus aequoreus TaxID=161455 RepID=UPI002B1D1BF3|nr:radiation-inducible immediate-early gene IEX-1 [Entelurus aequoreus]
MFPPSSPTMTTLHRREMFASSRLWNRSTQPEIFTFERVDCQAAAGPSSVAGRPKKRCTRVMYPAKVRMYLPPPERSPAKRWLLVLVLVLLWQIYTEEPCLDTPPSGAHGPADNYQAFPAGPAATPAAAVSACEADVVPAADCPAAGQQSAGNSYMVALLVYHRLGADK